MTYGSFGWAMMERARGAQQRRDTDLYKAQTDRISALKANGIGAARPATAAAPAATPAKPPTFSNISVTGSGIGMLPNAFGQASPTTAPINEGMPGSGTMGRTMYTTDAAGGVTVPERAGYQTTSDPMAGGSSEAFKDSMQENRGFKKGTEYVRKGITKVKDKTGNGSPTVDTVDAKLAEGEAVLNAGAAELIGREGIAELNKQGLKEMGMEGAQAEVKKGVIHAAAGYGPEEERRVLAALGMDPVGAGGGAALKAGGNALQAVANAPSAIKRVVQQPIMSNENTAQPAPNPVQSMTPGDAMRLRRPAEPQYSQQAAAPAGYAAPKAQPQYEVLNTNFAESGKKPQSAAQTFAARGVSKEDRSNYDLAEQGFGGIVRKAGNVYTDSGKNPYLDQQFQGQDGLTGKQLMERRIATDESRRIEAAAKDEQAKLDALEAADPRVRVARIEKEAAAATKAESAAEKKAAQDAAVNYAREQNPNLTKLQETAIRYGVKDVGKPAGSGDKIIDQLGKYSSFFKSSLQIADNQLTALDPEEAKKRQDVYNRAMGITQAAIARGETPDYETVMRQASGGGAKSFASTAEVEAAAAAGQIKPGDKVIVNGRQATWQ